MTATQIKRLAKQVAASTDKAEQRDIRTKLVALLNTVYVIEQLFYVARADRDAQPALEIGRKAILQFRRRTDAPVVALPALWRAVQVLAAGPNELAAG